MLRLVRVKYNVRLKLNDRLKFIFKFKVKVSVRLKLDKLKLNNKIMDRLNRFVKVREVGEIRRFD